MSNRLSSFLDRSSTTVAAASSTTSGLSSSVPTFTTSSSTISSASAISATALTTSSCSPLPTEASTKDISGSFTLHEIFLTVAIIALVVTWLNALFLISTHLMWRANIFEQRASMRISILPAVFCTFAFFGILYYGTGSYLDDIAKFYEAFTVAAFFNLMVYTVTPDPATREAYYVGLERLPRRRRKQQGRIHDKGSYRWYRVRSMLVYQTPVISFIVLILNAIIVGTMCNSSSAYSVATSILQIVNFMSQINALTSIVDYYRRLRPEFRGSKIMSKFLTYKVMVWLIIHQQLILEIIGLAQVVTPTSGETSYMSYADYKFGIPEFLIACETLVFSCLFQYSFSAWPYRRALKSRDFEIPNASHSPDASVATYLAALFYPKDIFWEIWQGGKTFLGLFRGAKAFDYTAGTGIDFPQRFFGKELVSGDESSPERSTNGVPHYQGGVPLQQDSNTLHAGGWQMSQQRSEDSQYIPHVPPQAPRPGF